MLTSTALVLFMTIPGLALFYAGMVRKKNVLATVMQSFAITCLVTIIWTVVGYSLAFTPGNSFIGGFSRVFLHGMNYIKGDKATTLTVSHLAPTIPESVYFVYQMTFAIITPALITRCVRRPDEVLGDAGVHGAVVDHRLLADRAHGLGTDRLAG